MPHGLQLDVTIGHLANLAEGAQNGYAATLPMAGSPSKSLVGDRWCSCGVLSKSCPLLISNLRAVNLR